MERDWEEEDRTAWLIPASEKPGFVKLIWFQLCWSDLEIVRWKGSACEKHVFNRYLPSRPYPLTMSLGSLWRIGAPFAPILIHHQIRPSYMEHSTCNPLAKNDVGHFHLNAFHGVLRSDYSAMLGTPVLPVRGRCPIHNMQQTYFIARRPPIIKMVL